MRAGKRLGVSVDQLTRLVPFRGIPHRHDFYHLFWVESGNGTFVSDGRSYPINPGSLIFVPPGQVHAWEWSEALSGYVLCFEPALLFSGNDRPYRLLHESGTVERGDEGSPHFSNRRFGLSDVAGRIQRFGRRIHRKCGISRRDGTNLNYRAFDSAAPAWLAHALS